MQLEWWYWLIACMVLVGLELLVPSFILVWFALGALTMGIVAALWPSLPVIVQLAAWLVVSICFSVMWSIYLKPKDKIS